MAVTYNKDGAYIEITDNGVIYRRSIRWEDCVVSVPAVGTEKIDMAYINGSDQLVLVLEDESEITIASVGTGLYLPIAGGTMTGDLNMGGQSLINVLDLELGTESAAGTFSATLTAANAGTAWLINSRDAGDTQRPRLGLSGGVDTAVWAWVNSTHTGIVLSGALNANAQILRNINYVQLDEITTPTAVVNHGALYTKSTNKFFFQDGAGNEHEVNLSAADVVGPASATDHAIVRFDGTTGKIIQDYTSNAPLISDGGIHTALAMIKVSDNVAFGMGNAGTTSADFYFMYETADVDARVLLAVAKVDADAGDNAAIILLCDQDAINVNLGLFNAQADDTEHRYWTVLDKDRDSWVGIGFVADDDARIVLGGSAVLTLPAFAAGGDIALSENVSIILDDVLSADEKWSGITEAGTAGAELTVGDLVYLASTGKWLLAKADAASTSKGKLGIVVLYASGDNQATNVLLYGKMRSALFPASFTVGAPVHIDAATAGDMVVAAPSGTEDFVVRIIGYGATAEDLFFCPDNTYIELAAP